MTTETATQLSLLDRRHHVNHLLREMQTISEEINKTLAYCADAPTVNSPQDAVDIIRYEMAHLDQEEFRVILLDTRNHVKHIEMVYRGNVASSMIRAAEVFRSAIIENAPAIILAHNHPSGDPEPSAEDVAITRTLVEAGKLLDIQILDHLVIGNGNYVSLKDRRLGF